MTRATFNVLFYIKRTKILKDGLVPIFVRITVNSKRAEFGLQKSIEENQWDRIKGCAKGFSKSSKDLNSYLDLVKAKLHFHKREMEEQNKPITACELKNSYMGTDNEHKTILEIFKDHNKKSEGLIYKDFSPNTIKGYKTTYNHVKDFIEHKYKRIDFPLNDITPMFVSDFDCFMKTTMNCSNNSTVKYIKIFKKIIRIALANGWMKSDPFKFIKIHVDEVDRDFLTEDELNILREKEFKFERIQRVKDVYIFCCFTGLAFIDVKNLKACDLITDNDNQLWIKKKRQKTKNWSHIPLLPPAIEVLNKYKLHPLCLKSGYVLPVLSNQRMNAYLKEIADICWIFRSNSPLKIAQFSPLDLKCHF